MGSLDEARMLISQYVDEYNNRCLQAALNYLTPSDYLKGEKHISKRLLGKKQKIEAARVERKKSWRKAA